MNRLEIFCLKTGDILLRRGDPSLTLPLGAIQAIFGRRHSPSAYFLFVSFPRASTLYEVSWEEGPATLTDAPRGDAVVTEKRRASSIAKNDAKDADAIDESRDSRVNLRRLHQVPINGFDADRFEKNQV